MASPFCSASAIAEVISDVAELTANFGGMVAYPSFPWSPDDVWELAEEERKLYLEWVRARRAELTKKR